MTLINSRPSAPTTMPSWANTGAEKASQTQQTPPAKGLADGQTGAVADEIGQRLDKRSMANPLKPRLDAPLNKSGGMQVMDSGLLTESQHADALKVVAMIVKAPASAARGEPPAPKNSQAVASAPEQLGQVRTEQVGLPQEVRSQSLGTERVSTSGDPAVLRGLTGLGY